MWIRHDHRSICKGLYLYQHHLADCHGLRLTLFFVRLCPPMLPSRLLGDYCFCMPSNPTCLPFFSRPSMSKCSAKHLHCEQIRTASGGGRSNSGVGRQPTSGASRSRVHPCAAGAFSAASLSRYMMAVFDLLYGCGRQHVVIQVDRVGGFELGARRGESRRRCTVGAWGSGCSGLSLAFSDFVLVGLLSAMLLRCCRARFELRCRAASSRRWHLDVALIFAFYVINPRARHRH